MTREIVNIDEIFYSIQLEIDVGKPSIFIRLNGCDLIKDEPYGSIHEEKGKEMSIEEIVTEVDKYNCRNAVITGGEPLLQKNKLEKMVKKLYSKNYYIDIETNGTLFDLKTLLYFDNINCSPKKQAINIDILKQLEEFKTRFKFVYEDKNDLWWEEITKKAGINHKNVYIMPKGKTQEEQLKKSEEVVEYCKEKGYNFAPGLQILIYNNWEKIIMNKEKILNNGK